MRLKKKIEIEDIIKLTNIAENYSVFELAENYLTKNGKKISKILNENNYTNEDCILILRTILNRSKRLLKLKQNEEINNDLDLTISSFKPPIFWKEKDIVKKQIKILNLNKLQELIIKVNDVELLVKRYPNQSTNLLTNFILEQTQ